jgi:RNA-dependent RNA polymerase
MQRILKDNRSELKLLVKNLPPDCDTFYIFEQLQQHGTIIRIEILDPRNGYPMDRRNAYVTFKPPPHDLAWVFCPFKIEKSGSPRFIYFEEKDSQPYLHDSPIDRSRKFEDKSTVDMAEIGFGVMKTDSSMLEFSVVRAAPARPLQAIMNLQFKCLEVEFTVIFSAQLPEYPKCIQRIFKMRINLPQIKSVVQMRDPSTGEFALVLTTCMPPMFYRKTDNTAGTHEQGAKYWNEWQTWLRQTGIGPGKDGALVQLQKQDSGIDVGRWLTYKLVFSASTAATKEFREICDALRHHNIAIEDDKPIVVEPSRPEHLWNWLDDPQTVSADTLGSSALSEMHLMAVHTIHLPFEVRYQLEACISYGIMNECNIHDEFLTRLTALEPERGVKLLEKVADEKERIFDPMEIFPRFLHKASIATKRVPKYCATIRSATVTPTTVYFMQAAVETSNSIIRKYKHVEDRFLRVKFTDEKYKGRVMSTDDSTMNEVYTRIKRAMKNGIKVGGRHYEFLAFGNSQFREGGAYFFAPTSSLTTQVIRNAMGDFSTVERVVAKYCARIGQAFATTRALRLKVEVQTIPDIWHGKYCFTDGVGKISPFLALMIAQEHGLPSSATDYPSVLQFRLGGCKGVLAVDPSLTGSVIQIRPSQRKFEIPNQALGLDICRISQASASNLNMQLILVLSALGVDDQVFLDKMDQMLVDLEVAMIDEQKALELLQRNIDFNQMTIQLAQMIFDGFMEVNDPFMISCLRLWRAWSIKYLKEKARIYIEHGTFVLGCVDETAILKGHFNGTQDETTRSKDQSLLPEIFLRIEQPPGSGKWTVITGICILARNPSLHPGDVRVVRGVDKTELYHYKNCVVMTQTGDRDLPNMCSGGDLDGDDYLVIWDKDLLPKEWNHPAMNFTGAKAKESDGPVTVDDMTSFFVTYMKYDNLSRIAVAHRYWADASPDGVKDPKCIELAELHSTAVDYVKTGVPAKMGRYLRIEKWPHWAEVKNKPQRLIYHSKKVLGKLYDKVQRVDMQPAWDYEFDTRILNAYELDDEIFNLACKAKEEYDAAVLRIMAKFSIKTEFEVWTTFVMEHSNDFGDYKFAETIGEETAVFKDYHRQLCLELAGADKKDEKYNETMGPFIAAMYAVTKQELDAALEECKKVMVVGGVQVPMREKTAETMPFISFPWLFPRELGIIANKGAGPKENMAGVQKPPTKTVPKPKKPDFDLLGSDFVQEPLPEVTFPDRLLPNYESLDMALKQNFENSLEPSNLNSELAIPSSSGSDVLANFDHRLLPIRSTSASYGNGVSQTPTAEKAELSPGGAVPVTKENVKPAPVLQAEAADESDEEISEENRITIPTINKSSLDVLEELLGE